MMLAATLFSGIGAPEEAMPHWDWRWCAEIDKFACAVLAQRHPHSVNLGDVAAHDFTERAAAIAKPDVIVFGSPCQSFSVAGRRLGLDDPRGNLALVALGIVDRLKPRWFVFENVPGLMSSAGGSDFGLFLRTVDELGYCCAWSVLDAQFFGVAQRRERVFVVGHLGADWRRPAAVLLEPEGVRGHHPPRREARERITPTISARTSAGGGLGTDHDINGGLITAQDTPDIAWALQERDAKGADSDTKKGHLIVADPITANEGKTYSHEGKNNFRLHNVVQAYDVTGTGPGPGTINAAKETDVHVAVAFMETQRGEVRVSEQANSLNSTGGKPGQGYQAVAIALRGREGGSTAEISELPSALRASQGGGDKAHVMATSAVRRLTPKECSRLQGFPDDYTLITYRGKPAADGPRYRALGNSMAVPVVRWILRRIEHLERDR